MMMQKALDKNRKRISVLGMLVDILPFTEAVNTIQLWASSTETKGRYVCLSNVHMCMETYDFADFKPVVNNADLVLPDGKPIYWGLKVLGAREATQIRGKDLVLAICKKASDDKIPLGMYGGTPETLEILDNVLRKQFPELQIVVKIAPPFRALTPEEDKEYTNTINQSGVKILLVGIGCPKQEKWMAHHKEQLSCVMLGVGAAFDFLSGQKKSAPKWMIHLGLEWLHRLVSEPRRLWKRYLKQNPRFVFKFVKQWIRS